jgi:hypothetical protein
LAFCLSRFLTEMRPLIAQRTISPDAPVAV